MMHAPTSYLSEAGLRPWRFDLGSALIGAAAALVLVWLAYLFRRQLRAGQDSAKALLARFTHYLQASTEDNYRTLVATGARPLTFPAHVAPLDAVFVEPRLRLLPGAPQSITEVESVLPPPLAVALHRVLGGHSQLAVLGAPGTGRTTLLAYLAWICARGLSTGNEGGEAAWRPVLGRLPLQVSLPAMEWGEPVEETGQEGEQRSDEQELDAVDRLLGAAVAAVRGSNRMYGPMRHYLGAGQAIILADGWDELPPWQQQRATAWLSELVELFPNNVWLVAAGERGYAPLTEAGFVPVVLAAWDADQVKALAERWAETGILGEGGEDFDARDLATDLQQAARGGARPLELALRAFVHLSDRRPPPDRRTALFERACELLLWQEEDPWLLTTARTTLGQIGLTLQQEGRASVGREEIEALIEAALPLAEEAGPSRLAATAFRALTGERGLLRAVGPGRYAFVHPLWQAYFAARQLVAGDPAILTERSDDARWSEVVRFYAEAGDLAPLVAAELQGPDDLFHTRLRTTSSWIRAAPEGAAWKDGAMATLARSFLEAEVLEPVRQALAESLAMTGVPGVGYFLRQALQHQNPGVRVAAAVGLGRIAGEADLPLLEAAAADADMAVRKAAVRALAQMNTTASIRLLERLLLEGDAALAPAVAGALAECDDEGIAFLREAAEVEDVAVRGGTAGQAGTRGRAVGRALGGVGSGGRTGAAEPDAGRPAPAEDRGSAVADLVGGIAGRGIGHRGRGQGDAPARAERRRARGAPGGREGPRSGGASRRRRATGRAAVRR